MPIKKNTKISHWMVSRLMGHEEKKKIVKNETIFDTGHA